MNLPGQTSLTSLTSLILRERLTAAISFLHQTGEEIVLYCARFLSIFCNYKVTVFTVKQTM
ncbi:hypothetical protein C0J52_23077 [Blattella germanica]|nr:hypothetical protein C0J52_23077 [Blattella germanica]